MLQILSPQEKGFAAKKGFYVILFLEKPIYLQKN